MHKNNTTKTKNEKRKNIEKCNQLQTGRLASQPNTTSLAHAFIMVANKHTNKRLKTHARQQHQTPIILNILNCCLLACCLSFLFYFHFISLLLFFVFFLFLKFNFRKFNRSLNFCYSSSFFLYFFWRFFFFCEMFFCFVFNAICGKYFFLFLGIHSTEGIPFLPFTIKFYGNL